MFWFLKEEKKNIKINLKGSYFCVRLKEVVVFYSFLVIFYWWKFVIIFIIKRYVKLDFMLVVMFLWGR